MDENIRALLTRLRTHDYNEGHKDGYKEGYQAAMDELKDVMGSHFSVELKKSNPVKRASSTMEEDLLRIAEYVRENPGKTYKEILSALNITQKNRAYQAVEHGLIKKTESRFYPM